MMLASKSRQSLRPEQKLCGSTSSLERGVLGHIGAQNTFQLIKGRWKTEIRITDVGTQRIHRSTGDRSQF
jgi:hypothetical protein